MGYDTRFLSDEFALAVARVIAGNGFTVQLADRPAPTPATSYRIIEDAACGGVMVTSSHNPFRWNGIKVKPYYGGSASPEIVADIERRVPAILANEASIALAPADSELIQRFNPVRVPRSARPPGRHPAYSCRRTENRGRPHVRRGC